MNSVTEKHSTGAKIFMGVAAILAAVNMIDFIFYGQELRHLLAAVGFALMTYGTLKNGFSLTRTAATDRPAAVHAGGRYANNAGLLLVLASIALRFMQ